MIVAAHVHAQQRNLVDRLAAKAARLAAAAAESRVRARRRDAARWRRAGLLWPLMADDSLGSD